MWCGKWVGLVGPTPFWLALIRVEEAFGDSVVVTVAAPTHRVFQLLSPGERRPIHAGELGYLIRVVRQPPALCGHE